MARTVLKWLAGVIEFDAVEIEAPTHETQITQYPVELGANLVDHIRAMPVMLRLTVWVSNNPTSGLIKSHMDGIVPTVGRDIQVVQPIIPGSPSAQAPTSVAGFQLTRNATVRAAVRVWGQGLVPIQRVQRVYEELINAQREGRLFDVATDVSGDFKNMAIKTVSFTRTAQMSSTLKFEIELMQIQWAELEDRDVSEFFRPTQQRAKPKKDAGKQQPAPADAKTEAEAESALHDAAPTAGETAANVVKGAFRFLGGG